jgi:ring-1,2-phenylacetyl-CoA epoxidase subunit PaaB
MSSLDPRVNRLGLVDSTQLFDYSTFEGAPFEMFWVPKPGKPYEHVGIVHATDKDFALLYAKEQYSRRGGNCYGLLCVASDKIWATPVIDDGESVFDDFPTHLPEYLINKTVVVFGLKKRGKQHILLGRIKDLTESDLEAQLSTLKISPCVNIWIVPEDETATLEAGEEGIWNTLPEKQYREAVFYKSAEKIKTFLAAKQ